MGVIEKLLQVPLDFWQAHFLFTTCAIPILLLITKYAYRLSPFHPLYAVPGPMLARLSSLYLNYHAYRGDEASFTHRLHQLYGTIIRVGPNDVDIADGNALHSIYVEKGGFMKPQFYHNFDIDGHASIFSATDPSHRSPRARAVQSIFSTATLRSGNDKIEEAVDEFISRLKREITKATIRTSWSQQRIDILEISRCLAIDVVTGYLFGWRYGGCEEDQLDLSSGKHPSIHKTNDAKPMTASAMVDAFVAVGKIWYFPPWIFRLLERVLAKVSPDQTTDRSIERVDKFVASVVSQSGAEKASALYYQERLLQAGFTESEVRAQCKDLIFAGTDSTAMNLATICFNLVKHPSTYQKLRTEIHQNQTPGTELQSLPYLKGVIKEGLRLAMANPSRLPRVVPRQGWTYSSTYLPQGTIVSCSAFEMHLNPDVYPEPRMFKPERWLSNCKLSEKMSRDHIPFGLGSRQCIARNLATAELFCVVAKLAELDLLSGLKCVRDSIEIVEWFNSHVVGGKIELAIDA